MTDLQDEIIAAIEDDTEHRATPEELNARGLSAKTAEIALACDDLVQAGELKVVGEREDRKLYELIRAD